MHKGTKLLGWLGYWVYKCILERNRRLKAAVVPKKQLVLLDEAEQDTQTEVSVICGSEAEKIGDANTNKKQIVFFQLFCKGRLQSLLRMCDRFVMRSLHSHGENENTRDRLNRSLLYFKEQYGASSPGKKIVALRLSRSNN